MKLFKKKRGAAQKMKYEEFKAAIVKSVYEEIMCSIQNYSDWNVFLRNDEYGEENQLVVADKKRNGWYVVFYINDSYWEDYIKEDFSIEEITSVLVSCFISMGKIHNLIVE